MFFSKIVLLHLLNYELHQLRDFLHFTKDFLQKSYLETEYDYYRLQYVHFLLFFWHAKQTRGVYMVNFHQIEKSLPHVFVQEKQILLHNNPSYQALTHKYRYSKKLF